MDLKLYFLPLVALVPMIVGFIWYHEKVFGKSWMNVAGMTKEKIENGNMGVIFGVSFVLSIFLAFGVAQMCIHQFGLFSLFASQEGFGVEGSDIQLQFQALSEQLGEVHRGLGHGLFHGFFTGFVFALPILATNAMFERKSAKYIAINASYWIVTLTIMGGLCTTLL